MLRTLQNTLTTVVTTLGLALALTGCGGGGGGGGAAAASGVALVDMEGAWSLVVTDIQNNCGFGAEPANFDLAIRQDGTDVEFEDQERGVRFSGKLNGLQLVFELETNVGGQNQVQNGVVNVAPNGSGFTGEVNYTISTPGFPNCTGRDNWTAVRTSETPPAPLEPLPSLSDQWDVIATVVQTDCAGTQVGDVSSEVMILDQTSDVTIDVIDIAQIYTGADLQFRVIDALSNDGTSTINLVISADGDTFAGTRSLTIGGCTTVTTLAGTRQQVIPPTGPTACTLFSVGVGQVVAFGSTGTFGNNFEGACGETGAEDFAVLFTADQDGTYTFDTNGSILDTVLRLVDVDCATELACDDDGGFTTESQLSQDLVAGQQVIVVIDGKNSAETGSFVLSITFDAQTSCHDFPISSGEQFTIETSGMGNNFAMPCGFGPVGTDGEDVAFLFTAPADGQYDFSTEGSNFDTSLAFFSTDCTTPFDCNDDAEPGVLTSSLTRGMLAGDQVIVVVDGFNGVTGIAVLTVTEAP